MDRRRLNTGDVIAAGILAKPVPKTDIPDDREEVKYYVDEPLSAEQIMAALHDGKVVRCSEYYGIPHAWREGETYRGALLQYRSVTEEPTFETAEEAAVWFIGTAYRVAG